MPCTYCDADGRDGCPIHYRWQMSYGARVAMLCVAIALAEASLALAIAATIGAVR